MEKREETLSFFERTTLTFFSEYMLSAYGHVLLYYKGFPEIYLMHLTEHLHSVIENYLAVIYF